MTEREAYSPRDPEETDQQENGVRTPGLVPCHASGSKRPGTSKAVVNSTSSSCGCGILAFGTICTHEFSLGLSSSDGLTPHWWEGTIGGSGVPLRHIGLHSTSAQMDGPPRLQATRNKRERMFPIRLYTF
ncbi:hypothetical protein Bbelb_268960 [Branchiostoma belcheri]|nr:hypothetical protein Bbelb_268960 [Branchiostoma belcheri]